MGAWCNVVFLSNSRHEHRVFFSRGELGRERKHTVSIVLYWQRFPDNLQRFLNSQPCMYLLTIILQISGFFIFHSCDVYKQLFELMSRFIMQSLRCIRQSDGKHIYKSLVWSCLVKKSLCEICPYWLTKDLYSRVVLWPCRAGLYFVPLCNIISYKRWWLRGGKCCTWFSQLALVMLWFF